jgi:spore coat polysaccharide biosynthesis protein SpsF
MNNNIDYGKVGFIIQARIGSTRLPGKVLLNLGDRTVIENIIERLKKLFPIKIIVATTNLVEDDQIDRLVKSIDNVSIYRGSTDNVLSRYLSSAKKHNLDVIIRITADCPLIDPYLIREGLKIFESNQYDIVTNASPRLEERTYPRGLDYEIFSYQYLFDLSKLKLTDYDKEHVTPIIYKNSNRVYVTKSITDNSDIRITLDTYDDYKVIRKIYDELYVGVHDFFSEEIINYLRSNPNICEMNKHVKQKVENDEN